MIEIIRKIEDLLRRINRLESQDSSKIVYLATPVRLINDTTARAAGYNTLVQVTGAADVLGLAPNLPTKISAVFLSLAVLPTAVGQFSAIVRHPSYGINPTRIGGYNGVAGGNITGMTLVALNSAGQYYWQASQAINQNYHDILGYII